MHPQPPSPHSETPRATQARPLTRRNTANKVYERLPEVEAQIAETLALDHSALVEVAGRNYESPAHVKDETLCYLIRERLRANRNDETNELIEVLLRRHAGTINWRVRACVDERHHEDCKGDITTELLTGLFDLDSDRSDFAQVRFGLFFKMLTTEAIKRFRRLQKQEQQAATNYPQGEDADDESNPIDKLADERALSVEDRAVYRDALMRLPDELRTIFILRHYDGWQIEADSADEPSISRYCNVTPRTVHNRLKEAEARLRRLREGRTR